MSAIMKKFRSMLSIARKSWYYKHVLPKIYNENAQKPINQNKIVFIEVRRNYISNCFELLYNQIKEIENIEISVHLLDTQTKSGNENYRNFKALMADIADAKCIFVNDSSEVMGSFKLRSGSKLVQTWHGCGAFKKWGFSTASLLFGETLKNMQKYPSHNNYTLVPISSADVAWAYSEAFNIALNKEIIQPMGVSRTDIFFDKSEIQKAKSAVETAFSAAKSKKIILYAPTFRGTVQDAAAPQMPNLEQLKLQFGENYVFLIKQHFLIKPQNRPKVPESCSDFALDVTDTLSIEQLLMTADICISDYSSLIFEYSLFEKPMIFYAYDINDYCDWRGFYYDYREFVPGPIVTDTNGISQYIKSLENGFDNSKVTAFKNKFMLACDGKSTERIIDYALDRTRVTANL